MPNCCAGRAPAAEVIHLLGDITEVWIGDDDDGPLAEHLREVLRAAAARCRVTLMHGNRDFLFGQALAAETGVELIDDPHLEEDGTLLSHGDSFCIDDEAYQQVRALFRSESWQQDVLSQPLDARRELARNLRAQSQATNANKAENIMDVAQREVDRAGAGVRCKTPDPRPYPSTGTTRACLGAALCAGCLGALCLDRTAGRPGCGTGIDLPAAAQVTAQTAASGPL